MRPISTSSEVVCIAADGRLVKLVAVRRTAVQGNPAENYLRGPGDKAASSAPELAKDTGPAPKGAAGGRAVN